MTPSFLIEDEFEIKGRGVLFVITLDRECSDFEWLLNKPVLLNGELYRAKGVERFVHAPPWRVGEKISLLADPIDPRGSL